MRWKKKFCCRSSILCVYNEVEGNQEVAGKLAVSPHRKKKGDFFRLIWAEIFLHKSLTDSGISHRFLRLFSFYTIAHRFEYLHICGIFLHRCREKRWSYYYESGNN